MSKLLIVIFFLFNLFIPTKSFCQRKSKNFASIGMQADISEQTYGMGFRASGGVNVKDLLLVGVGVGFSRIDNLGGPIVPFFAHFSIGDFSKKTFPYLIAEPGFGLYKKTNIVGNTKTETRGKLSFYGGAGMGVRSGKKSTFIITIGYSAYALETEGINENINGLAFKVGIIGL